MKKIIKNNKAITLIALIITIVIILILAAVTVNLTIGNNGIISKSRLAKNATEESENKEKNTLEDVAIQIGQYINSNRDIPMDYTSKIVNDFEIEIANIAVNTIKVSAPNVGTNNDTNVIGYIWFIGGKAVGVSESNQYTITGLTKATYYNNIYAAAIDETAAIKKSSNTLDCTTNTNLELYNATTFRQDLFSANYSNGNAASYDINSNTHVLSIYGAYCNRNFANFEVDLTNYTSAVIEWYSQNTVGTLGAVISTKRTGFGTADSISSSSGVVKYAYNTSTSSFITTTFDISNLTGIHYVGVFGFESGYNSYLKSITLY